MSEIFVLLGIIGIQTVFPYISTPVYLLFQIVCMCIAGKLIPFCNFKQYDAYIEIWNNFTEEVLR